MAAGLEAYQIFIKFSMIHCIKIYFYINMYIDIDIERIFFLEMLLNLVQWNELKKKGNGNDMYVQKLFSPWICVMLNIQKHHKDNYVH